MDRYSLPFTNRRQRKYDQLTMSMNNSSQTQSEAGTSSLANSTPASTATSSTNQSVARGGDVLTVPMTLPTMGIVSAAPPQQNHVAPQNPTQTQLHFTGGSSRSGSLSSNRLVPVPMFSEADEATESEGNPGARYSCSASGSWSTFASCVSSGVPQRFSNHPSKAFDMLAHMWRNKHLCDVILGVAGTEVEIECHRNVLASSSPYFYAMFRNDLAESHSNRIMLHEVDAQAVQMILEFMYTSEILIDDETVQILLPTANLLQIEEVRNACCEYLQSQLHPTNCLGFRDFADIHSCKELLATAHNYAEQHFSDVIQCDEFLALSAEQLSDLIASDNLSVNSEEEVFEAVVTWVNHDRAERERSVATVMSHVKFPFLARDYLIERVEQEHLMKADECKDFLIEAMKYHLCTEELKANIKSSRIRPRAPLGLPKLMFVVGGQAPKAIRSVECYDFTEERWISKADLPSRRCRSGVVALNGLIYACGGFNGSLRVRTVEVYDPAKDTWSPAPSMEARRSTLGAARMNGKIYAVGGFDGATGLNSAECFDPKTSEWCLIASMTHRRSSVGVGVSNNKLYAVGGYDGASRQCLNVVECYDPEGDVWTHVAEMSTRRSGAGVGALDGFLYAVGGHDGPMIRKSVERFDPELNRWSYVADMHTMRRNAGVVAVNGLLYVCGGDDSNQNLNSVEVYNPKTDAWTLLPAQMGIGRSYSGVVVLDKKL
ncbi:kelch-like protein 3 [Symsagittifera roscoffensis]|uniref:kelch-like protein 3 n=1 Tax=Symsagittifera roscoffensis TaxID=84072 RepID=UPI00307BACDA